VKTQPVLVLLNGIAAVVNLVLGALVVTGAITWDPTQVAAVVAAVQGGANLVALVVRASVYSPATHDADVAAAREGELVTIEQRAELVLDGKTIGELAKAIADQQRTA
jgi:hypothetical protein